MILFILRLLFQVIFFQYQVKFCVDKIDYKTQMMDFWIFFQTIALCISLIIRPIALDLPDSPSFAKKKSLPYISKIFAILSNIHFITIRYGPTGFSLWRDIVDHCMIGLKLYPSFIPYIFESLDGMFVNTFYFRKKFV